MAEWKIQIRPRVVFEEQGIWPFRKMVRREIFDFFAWDQGAPTAAESSCLSGLALPSVPEAKHAAAEAVKREEALRRRRAALTEVYYVNGLDPFVFFEPPADSEPEAPADSDESVHGPGSDSLIIRGRVTDFVTLECYTFPDDTASILKLRDSEHGYNCWAAALVPKIAEQLARYESDTAKAAIAIGVVERWIVGDL